MANLDSPDFRDELIYLINIYSIENDLDETDKTIADDIIKYLLTWRKRKEYEKWCIKNIPY